MNLAVLIGIAALGLLATGCWTCIHRYSFYPVICIAGSTLPRKPCRKFLGSTDDLQKQCEKFSGFTMNTARLTAYHETVFRTPRRKPNQSERTYEDAVAVTRGLLHSSLELFEKGKGNQQLKVRGSLWAAYNGVTELVDHHMNYRNRWQRLDSLWFGEGERTKHRAFDQASIFGHHCMSLNYIIALDQVTHAYRAHLQYLA